MLSLPQQPLFASNMWVLSSRHLWSTEHSNNVATLKIFSPIIRIESNISLRIELRSRMSDYDESCYPGPAEPDSDGEASPREQTSLSMDSAGPPPDFTCSVCSDILLDPVSLHCGHSFCQLCLAGVWQSSGRLPAASLVCPVCRLPWRNFPGVNITLRWVPAFINSCKLGYFS